MRLTLSPFTHQPLRLVFISCLLLTAVAGCNWVNITPEASQIRMVTASNTANCKRVGSVSSTVKARVLGISRNANKVKGELDSLAKQQAISLGANTLVPQSVVEGKGSYIAYRCP